MTLHAAPLLFCTKFGLQGISCNLVWWRTTNHRSIVIFPQTVPCNCIMIKDNTGLVLVWQCWHHLRKSWTAQGIGNPNKDSSTWNPESTGWNPESRTVMDSLARGETKGQKIQYIFTGSFTSSARVSHVMSHAFMFFFWTKPSWLWFFIFNLLDNHGASNPGYLAI